MRKTPDNSIAPPEADSCARLLERLQKAIADFEAGGVRSLPVVGGHGKAIEVELRDISGEEWCLLAACMNRDADWLHQCLRGSDLSLVELTNAMGQQVAAEPRASVSRLRHYRADSYAEAGDYHCVRCHQPQVLVQAGDLSTCCGCGDSVFYCVSLLPQSTT
ncbi:hypothetical protein [Aestuariirhabdus sp. LZHN29]|uniref:hypothetical protein n=1 Tax=Aestuariirhabdus sp. LZHN29 TaxID=3417462 RepID=UPI003CEF2E4D